MNIDDAVIGSGGFGVVIVDPEDKTRVIKLMRPLVQCFDAQREYANHRSIYTAYSRFVRDHHELRHRVAVPDPVGFNICTDDLIANCMNYNCSYTMERVSSSRRDGLQQHVLLNEDHQYMAGFIYFAEKDVAKVPATVTLTPQDKRAKRPRGAFLGIRDLEMRGMNVRDTAYLMGVLHGFVYKAGLHPKDVEIVLDASNTLVMYDFGMVNEGYTSDDREFDMYVPGEDDPLVGPYTQGVRYVYPTYVGGGRR